MCGLAVTAYGTTLRLFAKFEISSSCMPLTSGPLRDHLVSQVMKKSKIWISHIMANVEMYVYEDFGWFLVKKRLRKRFRPTSGPPSAPTRSKIKIWASSFHGQLEDLSNKPSTSFLGPHLHTPKRPRKNYCWKKRNGGKNRTFLRRYTSTRKLINKLHYITLGIK